MILLYVQYNCLLKQWAKAKENPFRGIPDEAKLDPNHVVWEFFDFFVAESENELSNKLKSSAYSQWATTHYLFQLPSGFVLHS